MTITLIDSGLEIKSVIIYTQDLEFELPNKRLEDYGYEIIVRNLYDVKEEFLKIEWYKANKVTLIKMIAKDEIKCIDIVPQ